MSKDKLVKPEDENFSLTLDGLRENKKFLKEQRDLDNPDYKYHGNCTKKFTDMIVDKFFDREYAKIRAVSLPDSNEHPFTDKMFESEVKSLIEKDKSWKTRSTLVRAFHKETFNNSNRKGLLTPNQAWKELQDNPAKFRKFYSNRLRCSDWFNEFKKNEETPEAHWPYLIDGDVPLFIYAIGLSTSMAAPVVSYFKPSLAKYLVKKYLDEFDTVYDPFSGLSGRMLGTLAAGKNYISSDINYNIVSESRAMLDKVLPMFKKNGIECTAELNVADSLKEKRKCQCVMTCSPYADSEQWWGQSCSKTCDQWIDIILENIDAEKYVFVVDDTIEKYRDKIVERLDNFSHFGTNYEDVVVICK